ncbi:serine protein kinase RIO [Microlunatus parietis]|uniref:non-specific serine/threonine protein kinase n=1 Tax=Microlunatus parietis TaxID=682979 RepID=A0A7Y9LFN5_9ACTN|nr:RIO1 family regulatory kinase/ATPase [Microlunatus parietis]NYE74311.1 RIO kinase 1 [Microlunatus parietis]
MTESRSATDYGFDFTFEAKPDLPDNQRWSRYDEMGVLTGPEPLPDWVITEMAIDTELGILKTGKEADVHLVERATDDRAELHAAKRYRSHDHRQFHRDSGYVEGRKIRNTRDRRAMAKGSQWGRTVEAGQWAAAEWGTLCDLWSAGLPVPYPIQLDGTEILMELITTEDGRPAPRLAQARPDRDLLAVFWQQLTDAMRVLASRQLAHGDLSPYNILATEDRIVIIDLPQVVDIVGNPQGMEFLARDCRNVANWFTGKGWAVDPDELLSELISYAW